MQFFYLVLSMELLRCCFVATDGIAVSVVVAADAVAATEVVVGC